MFIESAFYKLPELLTSRMAHNNLSESSLRENFAQGIQMELRSRNIERFYEHLKTEFPYPKQGDSGHRRKVDLLVDISGAMPTEGRLKKYNVREKNWLEMKAFLRTGRSGNVPKTENAGKIMSDLIRLCLLPEEIQGDKAAHINGRYFLLLTDKEPDEVIALSRSSEDRKWIKRLLNVGESEINFFLEREPESFRKIIGNGFTEESFELKVEVLTQSFKPGNTEPPEPLFWGWLVRINSFSISFKGSEINYDDYNRGHWSKDKVETYDQIRDSILNLIFVGTESKKDSHWPITPYLYFLDSRLLAPNSRL